jgi:hypothetical protein
MKNVGFESNNDIGYITFYYYSEAMFIAFPYNFFPSESYRDPIEYH